jgi:hypothetical protein
VLSLPPRPHTSCPLQEECKYYHPGEVEFICADLHLSVPPRLRYVLFLSLSHTHVTLHCTRASLLRRAPPPYSVMSLCSSLLSLPFVVNTQRSGSGVCQQPELLRRTEPVHSPQARDAHSAWCHLYRHSPVRKHILRPFLACFLTPCVAFSDTARELGASQTIGPPQKYAPFSLRVLCVCVSPSSSSSSSSSADSTFSLSESMR